MLPWKNSWFQIAFFVWLVSGALLIVDYAPKIPTNSRWMQAFERSPRQPSQTPAKPAQPNEQQPPIKEPAPARQVPGPSPTKLAVKTPSSSPSMPAAKDEKAVMNVKIQELLDGGSVPENNKAVVRYTPENNRAALAYTTKVCDAGKAYGCTAAGNFLLGNYEGIPQNDAKARPLYRRACDGGDQEGCYHTALYDVADRAAPSPLTVSRALEYAKKACLANDLYFCLGLGDLYRDNSGDLRKAGMSVSPDRAQAIASYRKVCAGTEGKYNDAIACLDLKQMNVTDKGVAHDYAQSLAINRKQCNDGSSGGCIDLGIMYENGLGVPTDLNKAIALFTQACTGGDGEGCAALKRLGK